jgi:hypothetical protein
MEAPETIESAKITPKFDDDEELDDDDMDGLN